MCEDNTALYLLLTSVKHLVYTESYLLFYCFVTVSLKNYHSVYQLLPLLLWISLYCGQNFATSLLVLSCKSQVIMLNIIELWYSTGTIPFGKDWPHTSLFVFLTDSPLCYSYMDSFKTSGERSCQKHFRIETFYIIQWAVSMGADKKLIHFQFQTK